MRIEADSRGPIRRIALRGELDNLNAEALTPHLLGVAGTAPVRAVLDLRDLALVTSAGLGHLIGFVKAIRADGGEVAFARPAPIVQRTISRLGLEEILPVADTVADAARRLGEEAADAPAPTGRAIVASRALLGATGVLFRPEAEDRVPEDRRAYPASGRIGGRWPDHLKVLWLPSEAGASEREFGARDVEGAFAEGARVRLVYRSPGGGREAFDERRGRVESAVRVEDGWIEIEVSLEPEE